MLGNLIKQQRIGNQEYKKKGNRNSFSEQIAFTVYLIDGSGHKKGFNNLLQPRPVKCLDPNQQRKTNDQVQGNPIGV
jgi:hypothetical protein